MKHVTFMTMAGGERYVRAADRLAASLHHMKFPWNLISVHRSISHLAPSLLKPALIVACGAAIAGDFCYFVDADMVLLQDITFDEIEGELVGVQHFHYRDQNAWQPSRASHAHVPPGERGPTYWQTCFFGGRTAPLLQACSEAAAWIRMDDMHEGAGDEPYLNRYFNQHRDRVRTLHPIYAAPATFDFWPPELRRSYEQWAAGKAPKALHGNFNSCAVTGQG